MILVIKKYKNVIMKNANQNIQRFIEPSNRVYDLALTEIKSGKKRGHWMWFIFPQIKGLGNSSTSEYYGIKDLSEAREYLAHPVLGKRLIEITKAVLNVKNKTAFQIFGTPDYLKLKSCMTLFCYADPKIQVFKEVLDNYFMGFEDGLTKIKLDI